ncbi:hypothetical protein B0H17DRAFT_1036055 [Mycena rosella]|uniref:J domain-containing protein n=1 Tax=Mycena rosella TaxID=1033263 RepID=A0AAD7GVJ7_MYCRO|nr:hypothetical protein B0H17DRAFT_1036055 [Mycena rosella]
MRRFLSTLSSTLSKTCASCSRPLPTPLPACNSCGTISPIPASVPFHDIFALPARPNPFIVDPLLLKRRFREAQAVCHPDTWASKGQHKQDIAQALSSRLNEAYHSLADPLRRAEYILEQNGLPIAEGDQLDDLEFIRRSCRRARASTRQTMRTSSRASNGGGSRGRRGRREWPRVKEAAVRLKYLEGIGAAGKQKREEIED